MLNNLTMSWITLFLDGLGTEMLNMINEFIAVLNRHSRDNFLVKLLLLPVLGAAKFVKAMLISPFVVGGSKWISFWIPWYREGFKEMLIHSVPNNLLCYNKIALTIYFVDFYCLVVCVSRAFMHRAVTYVYALLRLIMLVLPFMVLSPVERFPSWVLGAVLMLFEILLANFFIHCVGCGVDFRKGEFYAHWAKHYRYRRMTKNRRIFLAAAPVAYVAGKITFWSSFQCYNKAVAEGRLAFPYKPTKAEITSCDLDTFCESFAKLPEHLQAEIARGFEPAGIFRPTPPGFDYITAFAEPDTIVNLRYGVLFLLALSSLSVYSIILAGWASNSKYAFIGALRSAAQMISYEVAISLILLPVVLLAGSLNLTMITYIQSITVWFVFPLLPVAILFLIAMLAETNRTPFDLPEAEAELVAGYNVDYSSLPFAMFFLGEYCNMILISTFYCLLFLGGGLNSFEVSSALILSLKAAVIWVFFVNVRATLPRYRYDQLMDIGWKVFLPVAGGFLVFIFGVLVFFDAVPYTTELPFDVWKVAPTSDEAFFEKSNFERHGPPVPRGPYAETLRPRIDEFLDPHVFTFIFLTSLDGQLTLPPPGSQYN